MINGTRWHALAVLGTALALGAVVEASPDAPEKAATGSEPAAKATALPPGVAGVLGEGVRHWDVVRAVAFSPDGKTLLSASDDGTITVRDPHSGRALRSFSSRKGKAGFQGGVLVTGSLFSLVFSPDGKTLAAPSGDRTVKVWDVEGFTERDPLIAHTDGVFAAAFLPGNTLATASDDHTARTWDLAEGKVEKVLVRPGGYLSSLAVSPDGKTIACGAWDHTIRLHDASDGREARVLNGHDGRPLALAFAPNGFTLASGWVDGAVRFWDPTDGSARYTLNGHIGPVLALAYSPDKQTLASAGADGTVRLWEAATGSPLKTINAHNGPVLTLAYHPDSRTLVTGGTDGTVRLWDVSQGAGSEKSEGVAGAVVSVAYSPKGDTVATGDDAGHVKLWDVATGKVQVDLKAHDGSVDSVAFSPDGKVVATAGTDTRVKVWSSADGRPVADLAGHKDAIAALVFAPDGKTLASAGADKTIRLWDATSWASLRTIDAHTGEITSLAFSPDGRSLASAGKDRFIRLWDPIEGRRRLEIEPDEDDDPDQLSFSADGSLLAASGHRDLTVKLFDAVTGQPRRTIAGHLGRTSAAVFAPNGKALATSAADGTARIWDITTGKATKVYRLHSPRGSVSQVAFAPNGDRLVTVNGDGTAFILDLSVPLPTTEPERIDAEPVTKKSKKDNAAPKKTDGAAADAPKSSPARLSFLKDVAPVLVRNCVGCHNPKKAESKYDVTTFAKLSHGGRQGEGVTVEPGKPDESRLVELIRHDGEPRMPFKQDPLTPETVSLIERWVEQGARYDGNDPTEDWVALLHRSRTVVVPEAYKVPVPVNALAYSPDGKTVAASGFHEVTLWKAADGALTGRLRGLAERVNAIVYSPDGKWLATAEGDPGRAGSARLWSAAPGGTAELVRPLITSPDAVLAVAFSPDSSRVAAAGSDRAVRVWEVESGKLVTTIEDHADWVLDLAFSPDGKRIATASRDRTSKVFNLETREALVTFSGHAETVNSVAFQPDGKLVATGGADGQLRLWNPDDDAKQVTSFAGFEGQVLRVRYSPDGNRLFAASADGTVRIVEANAVKATLKGHRDWVYALSLSRDGSTLATGSWDGEVRLWDLAGGKPAASFIAAPGLASRGHVGESRR